MKFKITQFFLFISVFSFAQNVNVELEVLDISLDFSQIKQNIKGAPIYDDKKTVRSKNQISIPTLTGGSVDFHGVFSALGIWASISQ